MKGNLNMKFLRLSQMVKLNKTENKMCFYSAVCLLCDARSAWSRDRLKVLLAELDDVSFFDGNGVTIVRPPSDSYHAIIKLMDFACMPSQKKT
jgi:hypothetical protein